MFDISQAHRVVYLVFLGSCVLKSFEHAIDDFRNLHEHQDLGQQPVGAYHSTGKQSVESSAYLLTNGVRLFSLARMAVQQGDLYRSGGQSCVTPMPNVYVIISCRPPD